MDADSPKDDIPNTPQNEVSMEGVENATVESTSITLPSTPKGRLKKNIPATPETTPHFYEPFKLGWKREVVHRAPGGSGKRSDIYYYSPTGQKCRSMPDIYKFLSENDTPLKTANFTFYPEPISLEPFEVVRHAKIRLGLNDQSSNSSGSNFGPKKTNNRIKKAKNLHMKISKQSLAKYGEIQSSQENPEGQKSTSKVSSKIKLRTKKSQATPLVTDKELSSDEEMDEVLCSFLCENVSNNIPTLACSFCLTLSHPECVKDISGTTPYLCRGCMKEAKANIPNLPKHAKLDNSQILDALMEEHRNCKELAFSGSDNKVESPQPLSLVRLKNINRQNGMPLLKELQFQQPIYPSSVDTQPLPTLIPLR